MSSGDLPVQISASTIQNVNKVSRLSAQDDSSCFIVSSSSSCVVLSSCQTICESATELETNNKYNTSISCASQLFVYLLAKNNNATETSLAPHLTLIKYTYTYICIHLSISICFCWLCRMLCAWGILSNWFC